jgi:hypothetical protein
VVFSGRERCRGVLGGLEDLFVFGGLLLGHVLAIYEK